MAYFYGKKTGLTPSILGQLGLNVDRSAKTPSLLSQASGAFSPAPAASTKAAAVPTASTAASTVATSCEQACDQEYNACMNAAASLEEKQACVQRRNDCKAECGGGEGGGGGAVDPDCSGVCTANYNACMDAAASLEEKQACKEQKDACLAQCGEQGNESCSRVICAESGLLARDSCPTKFNQTFTPCSSAPIAYCDLHNAGANECPEGTTWDPATQTCKAQSGECGLGANGTHPGCACGKWYDLPPGESTCQSGYVPVQKEGGVRCECQAWCLAIGYEADCVTETGAGGDSTALGEYQYPTEIQDLMSRLLGRANTFLGMKPGFSQSALDQQFGVGYDKVRRAGTATQDATKAALQEQGLLGTGTELGATQANAWNTERNVADLQREVFAMNEAQKRNDLVSFTDQANKLFQAGLTFEQIREAINSARRSEGQTSLAMLLQYLLGMGSLYNNAG